MQRRKASSRSAFKFEEESETIVLSDSEEIRMDAPTTSANRLPYNHRRDKAKYSNLLFESVNGIFAFQNRFEQSQIDDLRRQIAEQQEQLLALREHVNFLHTFMPQLVDVFRGFVGTTTSHQVETTIDGFVDKRPRQRKNKNKKRENRRR